MKKSQLALLLLAFTMFGCAQSMKVTGSWKNEKAIQGKNYDNSTVFIAVITHNIEAKNVVETDVATALAKEGIKTILSTEVFPPNFDPKKTDKAEMMTEIQKTGANIIFSTSLIDATESTRYVPGGPAYMPMGGYYGSFYGYYGYGYGAYSTPGYYETDKTYFLETNIYDAQSGEMLYSMQSEAYNPTKISNFSRLYTEYTIQQLKKDGILK